MSSFDFGRNKIKERQMERMDEVEQKRDLLRKTIESISRMDNGELFFRYLYILCGGEGGSVRREKEGMVDVEDTLIALGARSVWENIRANMTTETVVKVERHYWEK